MLVGYLWHSGCWGRIKLKRLEGALRRVLTSEADLLGEVIEDYPEDRRGVSCLVSYVKQSRALPR